jgi:hypothetical protein
MFCRKTEPHGKPSPVTKNFRYGIKDIAITVAILALLLLLAQLFLQPSGRARDLVFGDLGRVHSALTNLTESTSESPIVAPTNNSPAAPPTAALPLTESNASTALTPTTQPTNNAMAAAVAAAMAAPPLITTQLSPSLVSAPQPLPSFTPPPDARPVITASVPPPPPPPAAPNPSRPPVPYTPPPTPEPDSKTSTADLLAAIKGDAPAPLDRGPTSTTALLGVDSDKPAVIPVASNTTTVATPSEMPGRSLPAMTSETNVSFVVDQSLSMRKNGKTGRARSELLKTLETMGPAQTFYVLFFHSGGYEGMPGLGPMPATPDNIRAMTNWLFSVGHRFGSDPAKAMRRALGVVPAPDTVWLISDGEFSKTAVQTIREANETVNAHINTVALYSTEGQQVMRQIADENRGICRFIAPPP